MSKKQDMKKQAFIYLGPSIPGGLLFHGALFKGEAPPYDEIYAKYPSIKNLLIEVGQAPYFKAKLQEAGSLESELYQRLEQEVKPNV